MDTSRFGRCIFLQFILIYYHYGVRSCTVTVNQKEYSEALLGQTANVSCQYTASDCPAKEKIVWFRYLASTHEELYSKSRFEMYNTESNTLLRIEKIAVQDSGIYICGIAFPGSNALKSTGRGTMLIIRDKRDGMVTPTNTALIVLCTLLFIYCVAVFSYYSYKTKCRICKSLRNKRGFTKDANKTYRTRSVFQAIAAEYHKRYDRKVKKQNQVIEDDRIYQNTQDLQ